MSRVTSPSSPVIASLNPRIPSPASDHLRQPFCAEDEQQQDQEKGEMDWIVESQHVRSDRLGFRPRCYVSGSGSDHSSAGINESTVDASSV